MANAFVVSLGGRAVTHARIHVPRIGVWWADLDLADDSTLQDTILIVGNVALKGTIIASLGGTFGLARRVRLVGGANGWANSIAARAYHNDAGVKSAAVISDAASECGETIGTVDSVTLGPNYSREAGPAGRTIEDCSRGTSWFVDFAGVTHVTSRASTTADPATYQVLNFDPKRQEAELVVDELDSVTVGQTIKARADRDLLVSSLDIDVSPEQIRVIVYSSGDTQSQLADAIRSVVSQILASKFFGKYRYRVVSMAGDRVNVQPVRTLDGLPEMLSISMQGAPGIHAVLALGAHVFVEFEGGDRSFPAITSFAGKDTDGHVPQEVHMGGADTAVARAGDLTQQGGPGLVVTLTPIGGIGAPPNNAVVASVPHFLSFSPIPIADVVTGLDCQPLYGAILTGSDLFKMKAGA